MRSFFVGINYFWVFVLCIQNYIDGTVLMILVLLYILYYVYKDRCVIRIPKDLNVGVFCCLALCGTIIGSVYLGKYYIRDYLRDIYYFLQPIIYLYAGYIFYIKAGNKYNFYKTVVFSSFILCCLYMFDIFQNINVLFGTTVVNIRNSIGRESFIVLFALFSLITRKDGLSKITHKVIFIVTIATFVLQFSRTSYGTLIIVIFVYLMMKDQISVKFISNIFRIGLAIGIIWCLLPNTLTTDFLMRIQKSILEVSSKSSFSTLQDIHSRWRGYETHLVLMEMKNANLFTQLFGFGFGKTTALDFKVNLGGEDFTKIATFHNGYIFVLLKNGILGLMAYISYYIRIILKYRKIELYEARMLVAYSFGMLFLTYTKSGLLRGKSVIEICLYFGFCIGYILHNNESILRTEL